MNRRGKTVRASRSASRPAPELIEQWGCALRASSRALGGTAYLTLRDQVVLRARSFKGLSNRQAAILLDIHPGHYSRLRRAAETKLRELRRLINESGGDSECLDEILSRIDKRS